MAKTILDWAKEWAVRDAGSVKFTAQQWEQIERHVRDEHDLISKLTQASEGLVRVRRVKTCGEGDGHWEVERIG
jgi:hypothetical protein